MRKVLAGTPKDPRMQDRFLVKDSLVYVAFNGGFICDRRCRKCALTPLGESIFETVNERRPRASLVEVKNVIESARRMGAEVFVMMGEGEPMLEPYFWPLIEFTTALDMKKIIFSHGGFIGNKEIAARLVDSGVSFVFSFDSSERSVYNYLAGDNGDKKGFFEKSRSGIKIAKEAYKGTSEVVVTAAGEAVEVVRLAINTVVSRFNISELAKIRGMFGEEFMHIFNSMIPSGKAEWWWPELVGSDNEFKEQKQVARQMSENQGPSGITPDGEACAYLRHSFAFDWSGLVLTCPYDLQSKGKYGNIVDEGFSLEEVVRERNMRVGEFYKQHGKAECLLRHTLYEEWKSE